MISDKKLLKLGLSAEQASEIRQTVSKHGLYAALKQFDSMVNNHGIEAAYVRVNNRKTAIQYSNTGETYAATLLLIKDSGGERLVASDVGRWLEKATQHYTPNQYFGL